MGQIQSPTPAFLLLAAISRHADAICWARERAIREFGPIALSSDQFEFTETDYYTPAMGADLKKQFLVFERLADPGALASIKCDTNRWEAEYATLGRHSEPRPLNLDPGLLTPAKLVLASTKDHAHRIYLRDGIFAEVTLVYRQGQWQALEWTYPDYRRDDYQQFFTSCREWLLNCGRQGTALK
jgi:hypothetical protein